LRKQRHFFATLDDLRPRIAALESQRALEYQLHGMRDDRVFETFASLLDAPCLGTNRTGAVISGDCYLVYPRGARPRVRALPQDRGGVKYEQDLSTAPEILLLHPGGVHPSGALIAGRIAPTVTTGTRDRGVVFYREFAKELVRGFRRIQSYWVGPDAYRALEDGKRLVTIGLGSPPAYDLAEATRISRSE